jgi:hypothetical protein
MRRISIRLIGCNALLIDLVAENISFT